MNFSFLLFLGAGYNEYKKYRLTMQVDKNIAEAYEEYCENFRYL